MRGIVWFGSIHRLEQEDLIDEIVSIPSPRPGALNFFQVGVCGPDFRSVGLANWCLPLKRGLVNWKFPNLGACELKISKFGGLRAKTWAKIEAVQAKISKFSQKGILWTDSFAWNGTLANYRRGVKGVFRAAHSHTHFLDQCPPPSPGPSPHIFLTLLNPRRTCFPETWYRATATMYEKHSLILFFSGDIILMKY